MKKTLILISDYIEGQPVVASVRYTGIMNYFADRYSLLTINDTQFGSFQSRFSTWNYKFTTPHSIFTQTIQENEVQNKRNKNKKIERILRNKWIVSTWRNYKLSKYKFDQMNKSLFNQLDQYLSTHEVAAIWVTVPDVYGLYILDYIKKKAPHIPAVIEIRDIINNDIGEGNPKRALKRAEKIISKLADGVVAVSQGIHQYYQDQDDRLDIQIIKNGYDEQYFIDSEYQPIDNAITHLELTHIGSIYKGRNIKQFIEGLIMFHERTGILITFNIVGVLDQQALHDIQSFEQVITGISIRLVGTVKHAEAIHWLKEADIAVILTHTKGSNYAIPGKTFEYIGGCKPIIAVTEDEELIALVHGKYGECAKHHREDIADRLSELVKNKYDYSDRGRFSRKSQAEQLIQFIENKMNN
ncbi:hypothetical protein ACP8HI_04175 [Paenibacillus sp. FA6]|uniref:hypothetical protein n=1 Tax=Paenibacillus sp. FA6 TaxID=3413029 RepID=UPI003F6575EA